MTKENAGAAAPVSFTGKMRVVFRCLIEPAARFFLRLGLTPDAMTLIGLAGGIAGGVCLALGWISLGGLIILLSAPLDALDGAMARARGITSTFGAFLDSVTDRWAELFLFGGLIVTFSMNGDLTGVLLTLAALSGSLMVSYTKARAEGLGFSCNVGILTRLERYLVLCPALLFNVPKIGVGIVALFGISTVFQRIWHVRRQSQE